jgi:hypothetical protein
MPAPIWPASLLLSPFGAVLARQVAEKSIPATGRFRELSLKGEP